MSGAAKGILVIAVIGFVAVIYMFFVDQPEEEEEFVYPETVADYLNETPIFLDDIEEIEKLSKRDIAPDFVYYSMDNRAYQLSAYRGQKNVVLMFWRTWNQTSRDQLFVLQKFYLENYNEYEIIAINSEAPETQDEIEAIVLDKECQFPIMHDPSEAIQSLFVHRFIPYYIFVDKEGKMVDMGTTTSYDIEDVILCAYDPTRTPKARSGGGWRSCSGGSCGM